MFVLYRERKCFMKRVIDETYGKYSVYTVLETGIDVKCPNCSKRGIVSMRDWIYKFECTNCNKSMKTDKIQYRYDVHNKCESCGRYYRVDITDEKQKNYPTLRVPCSYCGHVMQGKVQKTQKGYSGSFEHIEKGCEAVFGLELWFLSSFDSKPVWALNREHLVYLIEYLSADLREDPVIGRRTQADHLPTFMKLGKNRDKIVKLLKDMEQK